MSVDADPALGAVVPVADTDIEPRNIRAVYVGGGGNLAVITSRGETVTFTGVPDGTLLPIRIRRVLSSGTTATNILALY